MIYFTEIAKDKDGNQGTAESVAFQFQMKELPESIKFPFVTKLNKIEYNGGFITNQIIGTYQREIEWEGCFFGTYTREDGMRLSAKERADQVKKFMGRPIRVGFAVPNGTDEFIPGEDYWTKNIVGKPDDKLNGIVGVYIIEEFDMDIINYSDVNYRIKIVPHMRQEKIKPTSTKTIAVKVNTDTVASAAARIGRAVPAGTKKPALKKAAGAAKKATTNAKAISEQPVKNKPRGLRGAVADGKASTGNGGNR